MSLPIYNGLTYKDMCYLEEDNILRAREMIGVDNKDQIISDYIQSNESNGGAYQDSL
jgi:hypothetical protein